MKISRRAVTPLRRVWALIALLVWLCAACSGKNLDARVHGTWRADLSPGQDYSMLTWAEITEAVTHPRAHPSTLHATLTLKPDGAATITFTSPQGASSVDGTYKLTPDPDNELAFSLDGTFDGQAKTLHATLINGGESLSLDGLIPDLPAVTLARLPQP